MFDNDRIAADRAVIGAATPGPWEWICDDPEFLTLGKSGAEQKYHVLSAWKCNSCQASGLNCLWPKEQDADFIAAARSGWPAALDEVERLRNKIIHCAECRYWSNDGKHITGQCTNKNVGNLKLDSDFCSYGLRLQKGASNE